MNTTTENENVDHENALKAAFYAIRELSDPANKIGPVAGRLAELIVEAQNGTITDGGQQ